MRRILAPLVAWLLRGLAASWRVRFDGALGYPDPTVRSFLGATWHRAVLISAGIFRDTNAYVPVSRSRDGEHMVAVMARMGYAPPPRGSSSSSATSVLKSMVRIVRTGGSIGIFADGPRGPARVAKPGLVALARLTGQPMHAVGIAARPSLEFKSWDRTLLPLPFARVLCRIGDPIPVPSDATQQEIEAFRELLEAEISRLTDELEAELTARAS
jgi:lysophospholipid acyltransferase (LPLAT)-like uncharacterized protein